MSKSDWILINRFKAPTPAVTTKIYLVVQSANTGFIGLENVGRFNATNRQAAIAEAKKQWNISNKYGTVEIHAFDLADCPDGWSYYTTNNKR